VLAASSEGRTICSLMTLPSSSTVRIFCRTIEKFSCAQAGLVGKHAPHLCRFMSMCASVQYMHDGGDADMSGNRASRVCGGGRGPGRTKSTPIVEM